MPNDQTITQISNTLGYMKHDISQLTRTLSNTRQETKRALERIAEALEALAKEKADD